jgi:hypothetical protein
MTEPGLFLPVFLPTIGDSPNMFWLQLIPIRSFSGQLMAYPEFGQDWLAQPYPLHAFELA